MIKRQLGGLITDYVHFSEKSYFESKNKQSDNMIDTLNEFRSLKLTVLNQFKILKVEEMPQKPQNTKEYIAAVSHLKLVQEFDILATNKQ